MILRNISDLGPCGAPLDVPPGQPADLAPAGALQLSQNPARDWTRVSLQVPAGRNVEYISIVDAGGRLVPTMEIRAGSEQPAVSVDVDMRDLRSGVYWVVARGPGFSAPHRLLAVR